jgi:hypothetical protein
MMWKQQFLCPLFAGHMLQFNATISNLMLEELKLLEKQVYLDEQARLTSPREIGLVLCLNLMDD